MQERILAPGPGLLDLELDLELLVWELALELEVGERQGPAYLVPQAQSQTAAPG